MKKVYSAVLIANLLIERTGALALFAAPEFLVDAGNAGAVLGILLSFHLAIAVALAIADELLVDVEAQECYARLGRLPGGRSCR